MAKKTTPGAPPAAKTSAGAATLASDAPASAAAQTAVKKEVPASPAVGAEKSKSTPKSSSRSTPHEVTWAAIADRAFFLYKNGSPGSAEDHWRQAEHELRGN